MATVQDLFDEQNKTDMLITRLRLTMVGVKLGKYSLPTADQMTSLHRQQMDSNQRLAGLIEQLQDQNASKAFYEDPRTASASPSDNVTSDGGRVSPSGEVWTIPHGGDD